MSKGQVTEDELARTIGLDKLDDHPLNFGRKPKLKETPQAAPIPLSNLLTVPDQESIVPVRQQPRNRSVQQSRAVQTPLQQTKQTAYVSKEIRPYSKVKEPSDFAPKKADLYPRRIGIGMNDELKSQLDTLTAIVQGLRREKNQRHTTNTVVRCALRYVIDNINFQEGDSADTEEELFELFCQRLGGQ